MIFTGLLFGLYTLAFISPIALCIFAIYKIGKDVYKIQQRLIADLNVNKIALIIVNVFIILVFILSILMYFGKDAIEENQRNRIAKVYEKNGEPDKAMLIYGVSPYSDSSKNKQSELKYKTLTEQYQDIIAKDYKDTDIETLESIYNGFEYLGIKDSSEIASNCAYQLIKQYIVIEKYLAASELIEEYLSHDDFSKDRIDELKNINDSISTFASEQKVDKEISRYFEKIRKKRFTNSDDASNLNNLAERYGYKKILEYLLIGDRIEFGNSQWYVVDINKNIIKLLSSKKLSGGPFSSDGGYYVWEKSDARMNLFELYNSNKYFSEEQKKMIMLTHNINSKNSDERMNLESDTDDYIYLPTYDEYIELQEKVPEILDTLSDGEEYWFRSKGNKSGEIMCYKLHSPNSRYKSIDVYSSPMVNVKSYQCIINIEIK